MNITVKETIPGLREATKLNSDIRRLGIPDVELMYDSQIKMWAVCQVFKPSGKILLLDDPNHYETQPTIMFWVKDSAGRYRTPSDQDLSDIIVITKRALVWFDKGSDKMVDEMEKAEEKKHDDNRRKQSERIRSYAKPLKKLLKEI